MASINRRTPPVPPQGGVAPQFFEPSNTLRTHEGAPAAAIPVELQLRRSVCSCLLWENQYYESGAEIGERIVDLARQVPPQVLANLAEEARSHFHLRHVPLLLTAVLARTGSGSRLVGDTIAATIQRADELSEFLAIYAKVNNKPLNKIRPLSAQVKKGLARAYTKFDQYQLAKYVSASGEPVKGRDVLFLTHAKPTDEQQADIFKRIAEKLPIQEGGADTWEVGLSRAGANKDAKRAVFERLLQDRKLGYLALLRNLRNMAELDVDADLVRAAILARRGGAHRVLPFRFVAAARACPAYESELDAALTHTVHQLPALPGSTVVLVDVSSSMDAPLSARSDLTRMDAACTLAAVLPCERARVFSFSDDCVEVALSPGLLALISAIKNSQRHDGTYLGGALNRLAGRVSYASGYRRGSVQPEMLEPVAMDRLVVITDEQSHDFVQAIPGVRCYLINVASYRNGVGYGENFVHLDGFSEQIIRWIVEYEKLEVEVEVAS